MYFVLYMIMYIKWNKICLNYMYFKFLYCVVIIVKMWSFRGGLVYIFRGYFRAVISIVVYFIKLFIIVIVFLDGLVRMWLFNIMEIFYR